MSWYESNECCFDINDKIHVYWSCASWLVTSRVLMMRNVLIQRFYKWFIEWAVLNFLADLFLTFCVCIVDSSLASTVIASWEKLSYSTVANSLVRVD